MDAAKGGRAGNGRQGHRVAIRQLLHGERRGGQNHRSTVGDVSAAYARADQHKGKDEQVPRGREGKRLCREAYEACEAVYEWQQAQRPRIERDGAEPGERGREQRDEPRAASERAGQRHRRVQDDHQVRAHRYLRQLRGRSERGTQQIRQDTLHGGEAGRKRSETHVQRMQEVREWEAEHGAERDSQKFTREILPKLQGVPLRMLMDATGLSLRYCSLIRRGEKVSHPRHWNALTALH